MTTKDALKAIGADAIWADKAQCMLLSIINRLELERDQREGLGFSPSIPSAALLDDIEALVLARPLQRPTTPKETT